MKIIKTLFIVLISIVVLFLLVAIFVPKDYALQRETTINKPVDTVFEYVKYLKNQDNFSVWAQMDPDMKKEFKGTDGTIGFISSWNSENKDVGRGEQEIIKIVEGVRIDFELRFYEPFEATDNAYMTTQSIADSTTKIVWGFDGSFDYPMNMMLLFIDMDEMLGKDLEKGLAKLKIILEE